MHEILTTPCWWPNSEFQKEKIVIILSPMHEKPQNHRRSSPSLCENLRGTAVVLCLLRWARSHSMTSMDKQCYRSNSGFQWVYDRLWILGACNICCRNHIWYFPNLLDLCHCVACSSQQFRLLHGEEIRHP